MPTFTAPRVRFDFDLVSDDLHGDGPVQEDEVYSAVWRWTEEINFSMRPEPSAGVEFQIMELEGRCGWPVVRVEGVLPHVEQIATAYWSGDREQALDTIFVA